MAKENNAQIVHAPCSTVHSPDSPWFTPPTVHLENFVHFAFFGFIVCCRRLQCHPAGSKSRRFFVTRIRGPSKLAEARRAVINSITLTARAATTAAAAAAPEQQLQARRIVRGRMP